MALRNISICRPKPSCYLLLVRDESTREVRQMGFYLRGKCPRQSIG
jgi:hypothetical protein